MTSEQQPVFRRVLLKLSGEALASVEPSPFDADVLEYIVSEISEVASLGVQIGIVVGGGNFLRGKTLSATGVGRISADQMGMLATLINALALRDTFEKRSIPVRILSAVEVNGMVDSFQRRKAIHHLEQGRIVIFAAGTGNPLVTTDSAASLRGIEVNADIVLKATTQVDGVYSSDPHQDPNATLYTNLTFQEALDKRLAIMDIAAFSQCRDHDMPIQVFNIRKKSALLRVILGEAEGTVVNQGESHD